MSIFFINVDPGTGILFLIRLTALRLNTQQHRHGRKIHADMKVETQAEYDKMESNQGWVSMQPTDRKNVLQISG